MAYDWITWAAGVLKNEGLTVVEHKGWRTRGLSTVLRWEPKSIVWHHDASAKGDSPGVPNYMISNFKSAGAQIWVDRKGRWHLVAAGRAAHAGKTLKGKPTNFNSIGIETDHTVGEDWPAEQLASLRQGTAALLKYMGSSTSKLEFHKTICSPPGRKVDPHGLDLGTERARVAALMTNKVVTTPRRAGPKEKKAVFDWIALENRYAKVGASARAAYWLAYVLPWRTKLTYDVLERVRDDATMDRNYLLKKDPGKKQTIEGLGEAIRHINSLIGWKRSKGHKK